MPLEYRIDVFFNWNEACGTLIEWVDELIRGCDLLNGSAVRDLQRVCIAIVQQKEKKCQPTDVLLGKVMLACLLLEDEDLCREALDAVMMQLPQPETVKIIEHFGLLNLKSEYVLLLQNYGTKLTLEVFGPVYGALKIPTGC
jgi:hypothetical protein